MQSAMEIKNKNCKPHFSNKNLYDIDAHTYINYELFGESLW